MSLAGADVLQAWIAARPKPVRALAERFPPGVRVQTNDSDRYYVVGYQEVERAAPMLMVSSVNPADDYEAAIDELTLICASCCDVVETA